MSILIQFFKIWGISKLNSDLAIFSTYMLFRIWDFRNQSRDVRRMQNIKAFFQSRPRYVKGTYTAKSVEEEVARKKKEVEEKRKAAAKVIVTDDDDSIFGIFSVYRNSEIHGEYYPDE
ncbi:hypothetical protein ACF0H5_002050 [Mactra antiquata]